MVKVGDRIKVLSMKDDPSWNNTIYYGDEGVVTDIIHIDFLSETQVWVKFNKGSYLALLKGVDSFEVVV